MKCPVLSTTSLMAPRKRIIGAGYLTRLVPALIMYLLIAAGPLHASVLTSTFLSSDANAIQVMGGAPYSMNDPAWLSGGYQNRNTFAYKVFTALLMLGYQTEMGYNYGLSDSHIRAIHAFQSNNGLVVTSSLDSTCLSLIDQQLAQREQALAAANQHFPLYSHMESLHANDISKDTLATIYSLPMSVLPTALQMDAFETVQCIVGQCVGTIKDAQGVDLSPLPVQVDTASAYQFSGAYFDPTRLNARLPSAAVHVQTVLHEYGHYLDGINHIISNRPGQPHMGSIDTAGFYSISYDLSQCSSGCCVQKNTDPYGWITKYAMNPGYGGCAAGRGPIAEDWAESFSMYVASGKVFHAAAASNNVIGQKYDWLKDNIFNGLEYDTDLPRDMESGCNDIHGTTNAVPAYATCNDNYIWDFTLTPLAASVITTPQQFSFVSQNNLEPLTVVVSNPITVSGINWPTAISVSGGEYSINAAAYVSTPGTVNRGDVVRLRQTTAATYATQTDAQLTIGGVSSIFSTVTRNPVLPVISGTPASIGIIGSPYSFTPTSSNAISFSVSGNLPPGLSFDTATGGVSGTPTTAGSYDSIIISAINGNISAALPAFTVTITAPVGSFSQGGSMANGRQVHTATLLKNGKVLVAGGYDMMDLPIASAELYDPASDTWSPAASMTVPRADHSAALLDDGTVLMTGGYDDSYAALSSAEIYDPATNTWTAMPSMSHPRAGHTVTLLNNGTVLVVGGMDNGTVIANTEAFDPILRSWKTMASLHNARAYHSSSLLQNGMLLVACGYDPDFNLQATAEQYDPLQDSWSMTAPLQQGRIGQATATLTDGTVMVTGGMDFSNNLLTDVEKYDPTTGEWTAAAPLQHGRYMHTATALPNGELLVTGGFMAGPVSAELYDPTSNSWQQAGLAMIAPQNYHSATLLSNGLVMLAGGGTDVDFASTITQLYDPGRFSISFLTAGNGTISGAASQMVIHDAAASSVTAIAAGGYHFVNWTGNGFATTSANPLVLSQVMSNMAITAQFAIDPFIPPVVPCDGIITAANGKTAPDVVDALMVLRHVVGLSTLNTTESAHADVAPLGNDGKPSGDGTITVGDALLILRRVVDLDLW